MVFPFVKYQSGITLIELVVTMLVGSMLILSLFSILSSTTHSSIQIQSTVLLEQRLLDIQQLLTKEIKRSGYQQHDPIAAVFSDQTEVVYVSSDHREVGMVYQVAESGPEMFRNLIFKYSMAEKMLRVCDKYSAQPLSTGQTRVSTQTAPCYAIFDPLQLAVPVFQATHFQLNSMQHRSGVISIEMKIAYLSDLNTTKQASFSVTLRNAL